MSLLKIFLIVIKKKINIFIKAITLNKSIVNIRNYRIFSANYGLSQIAKIETVIFTLSNRFVFKNCEKYIIFTFSLFFIEDIFLKVYLAHT